MYLLYVYECVFQCLYTKLLIINCKKKKKGMFFLCIQYLLSFQTFVSSSQCYVHNIISDILALLVCKFLNRNYD